MSQFRAYVSLLFLQHRHPFPARCKNKRVPTQCIRGLKPHCGSLQTTLCSLPTASLSPKLRKGVHMIVSFAYKVSLRVLMVIYRAVDPRKAQAGAPADKEKKSVAYVWRGSPPFLIESRLGAYILSSIGAVGGVSAAKRVETATGGCRKG